MLEDDLSAEDDGLLLLTEDEEGVSLSPVDVLSVLDLDTTLSLAGVVLVLDEVKFAPLLTAVLTDPSNFPADIPLVPV